MDKLFKKEIDTNYEAATWLALKDNIEGWAKDNGIPLDSIVIEFTCDHNNDYYGPTQSLELRGQRPETPEEKKEREAESRRKSAAARASRAKAKATIEANERAELERLLLKYGPSV